MKARRKPIESEIVKFEIGKGIEDGHYPYTSVITNSLVNKDNLVQITLENGEIVCPYVRNRRFYQRR